MCVCVCVCVCVTLEELIEVVEVWNTDVGETRVAWGCESGVYNNGYVCAYVHGRVSGEREGGIAYHVYEVHAPMLHFLGSIFGPISPTSTPGIR